MAAPKRNMTTSAPEAGGELLLQSATSSDLITSRFHRAANTISVVAPSCQSVLNAEANSLLSGATLSSSTFNDTNLSISSPPLVSFVSEFFRTRVPHHQRRHNNLVRGTQGWVSQVASPDLPEIVVRNICIAHYVELRAQSKDLTLSSRKGRRTAAFKATAKELSLQPEDVRKGCPKGVNFLLLARLGGPGSLFLIGKRARTLWEKDMLSEDVPHLLNFRRKHMPELDIQARKLNDRAIEIISKSIAAQGWTGLSLVTLLTKCRSSELHETCPTLAAVYPKENTAELSSDHRKRRHSAQPDQPSKRSAHGSSEDLGLMWLPKAAQHKCQNTFVDPFHQQVGGPDITTYMTTAEKNDHLNTWIQDLAPWPVEEPDITLYMTAFTEEDQSSRWMQDLASWPVEEPDITAYMTTFNEDDQTETQMKDLFLQPLEVPDLTSYTNHCEQEACLLP